MRQVLRGLYYKLRFAGRDIQIDPSCHVSRHSVIRTVGGGSIRIGAGCEIHPYAMLLTYGGVITLGAGSSVNPFTIIYGHGGTQIGEGVRIAAHGVIIPANHERGTEAVPLARAGLRARGISIGNHVWIGSGVRILDGVRIGNHAVIGAGSVVTRSVPDHATAVGVPARLLSETSVSTPRN